ncbi:TonB-dependent siderophore receptor [Bradyrhizobium sp. U87765 SZCCT0131]|uniref:TonB-dependent receptor n=1 Tax=unclassified Bradyrhizobium TaxID=2631580 RepID=UPI001BAB4D1E|nr:MULTISPECIES: TonB-dependent siderophore receptor [unclassified Bradyrhizobium]MBR1217681.1 TonB-dependent siderophore receptor [Bradyrhizobium sp. U87765 SZCCT0131]MBR1261373.1 TonB-dependent siderophore receptor [Bradyrhizobium sp. U87765 SZCCT0134]MBR1303179.1 TonB-dependent siderophore receptor [Bradyrhizobium sp. U87765 SZCCT0110]MBR1318785.1 TonB-dependent siderophore receptor [Bradyrhizobium sp. U87765 SZCCT0109]MBR1347110.1 TonB-dependent siderophore receptor [Bradyrhizobium sp. U87
MRLPSHAASRRRATLLCSVATALLLPADAFSQTAQPAGRLDAIEVSPTAQPKPKRATGKRAERAGRARPRSAATAAATNAPAGATPAVAAPTALHLTAPSTTGSRLGLTPLQTPASVEVISADTIAARGQHTVLDAVTQNAAGFTANPAPGNGGLSFSTRGFSGSNSVMTLYDGTRFYVGSGTVTFPFDTWSAQQIEVMRGPASVMYGEGAIGGIVNVVPKKPITTAHNEAEISLDTNMTRRLAVDSGGPINPNVSYRVTAAGNMSDGWVERDKTSNVAFSAAVKVQAADNLAFTLSNDYGDRSPSRYFGTPLINGAIDPALRFQNYNTWDSQIRYKDNWTQFKTEWDVADGVSVRNTTYYLVSNRHWRDIEAYTFNPATGLVGRNNYIEIFHDQKQLGTRTDVTLRGHIFGIRNEFVAGFDVNQINFAHINNSPYAGQTYVPPFNYDPGLFSATTSPTTPGFHSVTNQYALFAEDRLILTDQLALVGGVRLDRPTISRTDDRVAANSFETSLSGTSWRAGAVYTPIDNLAFYGQYATAVDPVGNLITLNTSQKNFQLATGRQVEVGVKQSFWGGRGEWTLAAYDIVKNNLLTPDPNNIAGPSLQVGQQSSRGIEASLGLALNDAWRVDANIALLRAKYDSFSAVAGGKLVSYAGNVPINVPQQVGNAWVTWNLAPNWSANAGVQVVGAMYTDAANTLQRPSYALVNAGLRWTPDARTTVALRIYNIFDKVYAVSAPYNGQWLLGMPRTAELSVNVKF